MAQKRKTTSSKTQKKKTNGNSTKRKTKQAEIPAPVVIKDPYDEEPVRSPYENELFFYIIVAGCILLLLSNFGLIGAVGDFCSGVMFGLMGRMAYVFPVMILAIPFFQWKHIGNTKNRKLAAVLLMMVAICTFISLLATKGAGEMSPLGHYEYSKVNHEGGGFVGGVFTFMLVPAIGVVGCYIVDLLAMLIALVLFFHVTVSEFVRSRFGDYEIDFSNLNRKLKKTEKNPADNMLDLYDMDQKPQNGKKREKSRDTKRPELKSISEGMKSIDESNIALKNMTPISFSEIKVEEEKKKETEAESPKKRAKGNTRERTIERTKRTTTGAPETLERRTATRTPQTSPRHDHSTNRLNLSDFTMVASGNANYSDEMDEILIDTYPSVTDTSDKNGKQTSRKKRKNAKRGSTITELNDQELLALSRKLDRSTEDSDREAEDQLDIHALSMKVEHKFENIPLDNSEHPVSDGIMQEIFPQDDYEPYAGNEDSIPQEVSAEEEYTQLSFLGEENGHDEEETRMYKAKTHYDPPRKHKNAEDDDEDDYNESDEGDITDEASLRLMKSQTMSPQNVTSTTSSPEKRETSASAPMLPATPKYQMPPTSLLKKGKGPSGKNNPENTRRKLQETLDVFGVDARVTNYSCGPAVTRFEIEPQPGVKVSRIVNLADDIKLNLAATDIRIEAPIPGKSAVGIEVPNENKSAVAFRDLVESQSFKDSGSKLTFAVGKDIAGQVTVTDIAKMPHLLIAGATGSGKSVCINTIIMSILFKAKPDEVKLIMIDPKVVELSVYNGIPHLMIPVVTDPKKAAGALSWAVAEMTDRYNKFAECHVRDIKGYNARIDQIQVPEGQKRPEKMFQIVIVVDELADLMMVASKEVEEYICRLAQLARACGIHLIIATQRPSVNVITGLIKANMPSRIAFAVTSSIDSRTILDMNGAEKLLGKGDMMFSPQGAPKPMRIQGAFISDDEVAEVVKFITDQKIADTSNQEVMKKIETMQSSGTTVSISGAESEPEGDPYFAEAGRIICDKQKASIGMLQRYLKVGFNRAARIMDQLQEADVVGPEEGTKPRTVLMSLEDFETYLNSL